MAIDYEETFRVSWESDDELPPVRRGQRVKFASGGGQCFEGVVTRGSRYANRRKAWAYLKPASGD